MEFTAYARRPDLELDLLTGALLIARDAYPALRLEAEQRRLDVLARPIADAGLDRLPAAAQARALSDHLYVAHGFRGNAENYHEPENSFLNVVLDRKLGIPISLSIIYVEVARRAGIRASGVGFPGHFLVRIDDAKGMAMVDPFFGGELLDQQALEGLLKRTAPRLSLSRDMLDPTPVRHVVARMLMNLRALYAARGDPGRLLVILDHLVDLMPDAVDEVRDRGYLCARLGAPRAAASDLRRYLDVLPHAGDAAEVRKALARLEAETKLLV